MSDVTGQTTYASDKLNRPLSVAAILSYKLSRRTKFEHGSMLDVLPDWYFRVNAADTHN